MTVQKRIDRLTNWQVGLFIVPVALHAIRLVRHAPPDSPAEVTWTFVRFGITVLTLTAVGVLGWRKRQIRNEAKVIESPIQPKFDL